MTKLVDALAVVIVLYASVDYIGHVSNTASDTAWRLGCTSTGMSASDCSALQKEQR